MAQCSSSDLIAQACQSGFTCRSEPELLALLNQLLCNLSSGGGSIGSNSPVMYSGASPSNVTDLPADITKTCMAYSADGSGSIYGWNPNTQQWV